MSNKMWGGRFAAGPAEIMEEINASIDFDQQARRPGHRRLQGPCRDAGATGHRRCTPTLDAIAEGLDKVKGEIEAGRFHFSRALEDIHMNVESRLAALIGAPAGRLHTARSRNDQVATDFKLWVRDTIDALDAQIAELQRALAERALAMRRHGDAGLHPSAIGAARHLRPSPAGLCRDVLRATAGGFRDARARLNECPLGAAALAGTSFPIDRDMTAKALGFDRPTANSLDSVADRDFALETLARGGDLQRPTCRAWPRSWCCGRRRSSAS